MFSEAGARECAFEFSLKGGEPLSTGTTMRGQNRVKISLLLE